MKVDEPCENALIKATLDNFKVQKAVNQIDEAQARFFERAQEVMEEATLEGSLPSASTAEWDEIAAAAERAARGKPSPKKSGAPLKPESGGGGKKGGGPPYMKDDDFYLNKWVAQGADSNAWQAFKQMRVAMMLSNFMTMAKNLFATGGQATLRVGEEGLALLLSQRRGTDAQHTREFVAYASGMGRAAMDTPQLLGTLAKMGFKKGAFAAEDMKAALKKAGYAEDLAVNSKVDLMQTGKAFDNLPEIGARFLNAAFGSQMSVLSGTDMVFKMISHRAKVQQLLVRRAVKQGKHTKVDIDTFVSENWDSLSNAIKRGEEIPEWMADIQAIGVAQAADDTFTSVPTSELGKFMAGKYNTTVGWKRTVSEGMQIVAPFRSIYVNLMKEAIPRRLLPFLDKQTFAELTGKMGPAAQDLAIARTAGAWTLLSGTLGLITLGGVKLHTRDSVDPAVRQLQFEKEGKVGGTFQIGDWYYPVDMLPPSVAIPLAWAAAFAEGYDGIANFRYTADGDVENAFMRGLKPFMSAVTDGPWVKEYLDFLAKSNNYMQHGNLGGFTEYLASITLSPMKPPRWMHEVFGVSPDVKTTDGFINRIKMDWWDIESAYGYRRNMAGMRITPPMRYGRNLDKPYFGMSDEVVNFLNAADYDKVYPTNVTKAVGDEALARKLGIDDRALEATMSPQAIDRFEYYVGQSRAMNGRTFEEDLKSLLRSHRLLDKDGSVRESVGKPRVQRAIAKIHSSRREMARTLVQYNPAFGIRQKQIDSAYKAYLKQFPNQRAQAEKLRRAMTTEMNMTVQKMRNAF